MVNYFTVCAMICKYTRGVMSHYLKSQVMNGITINAYV
jgi:hypothetical protein